MDGAIRVKGPAFSPGRVWRHVRGWSLWRDRLACGLLLLSLLLDLGLLAYVYLTYSSLPPLLPLHYNALGQVDMIGEPRELFRMPAIGTLVMVGDFLLAARLHGGERFAAVLLLGGCAFVQALLLAATVNVVRLA